MWVSSLGWAALVDMLTVKGKSSVVTVRRLSMVAGKSLFADIVVGYTLNHCKEGSYFLWNWRVILDNVAVTVFAISVI